MPVIRPYEPRDFDAVSRVCLLTAEVGGDASGLYSSDELMPDVYARPYVTLEPSLAYVVEDAEGVGGYILGVADTRAFVQHFRSEWMPVIEARYEHTVPALSPDERLRDRAFRPESMLIAELAEFPAHMHIDLLPRLQGQGLGRELIGVLAAELRARGVPGLHLGLSAANTGARAFYDRLGFEELPSHTPQEPLLGLRL